jgi:LysM repeat protein
MSKKVIILIAVAMAAMFIFAACERSAGQVVLATPTEAGTTIPTGISLVQAWGTSTAVAMQTAQAAGLVSPTPTETPNAQTLVPGATVVPAPNTTPVIVVPTLTPGHPAQYTLQKGEFPYCIARRFNVDPTALLAANGLTLAGAQALQPGLVLNIPSGPAFPDGRALNVHPTTYTVQVDDTIYRIACHFGDVDPSQIAAANNISVTQPLTTGTILNIP